MEASCGERWGHGGEGETKSKRESIPLSSRPFVCKSSREHGKEKRWFKKIEAVLRKEGHLSKAYRITWKDRASTLKLEHSNLHCAILLIPPQCGR